MGLTKRYLTDSILVVDGFISALECSRILDELEYTLWRPSLTYQRQADDTYKNVLADARISQTAHQDMFPDELVELLATVDGRMESALGVPTENLEWWQATKYSIGGKFDYHLDAGYWDDHYAGDRVRTLLLFLNKPLAGGGTHFRALDVMVEAQAGRLLAWDNLFDDGTPNHAMIHSGTPVGAGEKITLVTWQRQKRFRHVAVTATKGDSKQ